ncbi:MAG: LytTR family DNA-binding domain-containing protein [Bacteroidota bacterium]|nr:LytTR family DNA-binding domain-containing protein [Bacteroidota bacterium]MDP4216414.1 LytTR family DNA-binding domain-containing protein [Bacteroidota bacterium]MDP4244960.1 LytTR family DNA-binding domain-containing protein [Bacteroidota bacterium]MDP4252516.1 LytTR family DNA-binding domain-containing protein [Bacteroidota bacterium]MDP4260235.1 LytTR family DNA-binding domain-containing protein [Bacteroidota bacterium]
MLKAVIIDDELRGRQALLQKLRDYCPEVDVVGEATTGLEGIEEIKKHQPNVVFLDIEMPRMDGFDMLRHIDNKEFHIIFTTAYDQYAIKAIKYAAFDYLLKPVDIDELKACIGRLTNQASNQMARKLVALEENLRPAVKLHKIAIPTLEGLSFFNLADIIRLEAQSNYTCLYFTDQPRVLASRTLKEFEELLPGDLFFRAHHSHIINLHYIKKYVKGEGGQIEMKDGAFVDLARRKKEEFLKLIR